MRVQYNRALLLNPNLLKHVYVDNCSVLLLFLKDRSLGAISSLLNTNMHLLNWGPFNFRNRQQWCSLYSTAFSSLSCRENSIFVQGASRPVLWKRCHSCVFGCALDATHLSFGDVGGGELPTLSPRAHQCLRQVWELAFAVKYYFKICYVCLRCETFLWMMQGCAAFFMLLFACLKRLMV